MTLTPALAKLPVLFEMAFVPHTDTLSFSPFLSMLQPSISWALKEAGRPVSE